MLKRHGQRQQRGDTIVEVMIVLAILGLALGIAYATANKSLLATRAAQENSYATQLLQGQVEQLYALSSHDSTFPATQRIFPPASSPFCIDATTTVIAAASPTCTIASRYNIYIYYCNGISPATGECAGKAGNDDTFVLTAKWLDVDGQGTDTVTLNYRIHPS